MYFVKLTLAHNIIVQYGDKTFRLSRFVSTRAL